MQAGGSGVAGDEQGLIHEETQTANHHEEKCTVSAAI
jgi:hypothetical protein